MTYLRVLLSLTTAYACVLGWHQSAAAVPLFLGSVVGLLLEESVGALRGFLAYREQQQETDEELDELDGRVGATEERVKELVLNGLEVQKQLEVMKTSTAAQAMNLARGFSGAR